MIGPRDRTSRTTQATIAPVRGSAGSRIGRFCELFDRPQIRPVQRWPLAGLQQFRLPEHFSTCHRDAVYEHRLPMHLVSDCGAARTDAFSRRREPLASEPVRRNPAWPKCWPPAAFPYRLPACHPARTPCPHLNHVQRRAAGSRIACGVITQYGTHFLPQDLHAPHPLR